MNSDTNAAWSYHNATKHTVQRLQAHPHYLDWENKPIPFKVYPALEPIPLPHDIRPSNVPALSALTGTSTQTVSVRVVPDVGELARLLHFSAGITRKKTYPGGQEHYFRAAACTGALYHIDLYVICGDVPGLPAGVYHFGPHNFALYQLRAGDHRHVIVDATGGESAIRHAPVIIACASTYWRNSWKYQARAYRHCFWDCGTILANFLAVAAADEVPARVVLGFVDDTVSVLLGLDPKDEGPLALVALGRDDEESVGMATGLPPLHLETLPLSPRQVDYPAIHQMQAASSLSTAEEVRTWRGEDCAQQSTAAVGPLHPVQTTRTTESIDSVILRRGSARQFAQRSIGLAELSTILDLATRTVEVDYGSSRQDTYVIVNAVDGLQAGAYAYRQESGSLDLIRAGNFRREAGYLGLGQALPADASVNIYFLCDLGNELSRFGNRGYRAAQLTAAIAGGRAYLAAYALRLGATGLTFFDDDVTEFFSPPAAQESVMFLAAVGHGGKTVLQR